MAKCEGMEPPHVAGETINGVILEEDTPEHPCKDKATLLARSLKEVQIKGMHGTSFEIVKDEKFCSHHFKPGTVTHMNGMVTQHPAIALES